MKASEFAAAAAAVALSVTANARHLAYPEPTSIVALALDGVSPAPTTPPQLGEIFRRANQDDPKTVLVAPDATCGYISGRLGAPFVCDDPDNPCVFITPEGSHSGAIACCNTDGCATRASCVDFNEFFSSSKCDDGCAVDVFTLKCTGTDNPYCNTITFDGGIQDYWCNSVTFSGPLKAETTYNGQKSKITYSKLVLTDPSSTFFASTGTDKPAAVATSDADSDSKDDKEVNVGAIVGGVVGGVGAIGLAGILVWFILRQRSKKQPPNPPGYQPTLTQQPGSGPGGYNQLPQGAAAGYYDNKNPYALGGQQYPAYHADPNVPYDPRLSYATPSPSPSYHQVPPPGQQLHPDQQLLAPGYQPPVIQEAGGKAIIPEADGEPVIPEAGGKPVISEAGGESVKPKAQELA